MYILYPLYKAAADSTRIGGPMGLAQPEGLGATFESAG